jgi:hypothetical protein
MIYDVSYYSLLNLFPPFSDRNCLNLSKAFDNIFQSIYQLKIQTKSVIFFFYFDYCNALDKFKQFLSEKGGNKFNKE